MYNTEDENNLFFCLISCSISVDIFKNRYHGTIFPVLYIYNSVIKKICKVKKKPHNNLVTQEMQLSIVKADKNIYEMRYLHFLTIF